MIYFLFGLLFSSFAGATGFECSPKQAIAWTELSPGVQWTEYDLDFTPYLPETHQWELTQSRSVKVRAFKVDYLKNKLLFHSRSKELTCNPLQERFIQKLIEDSGSPVIGAINASFFVMPNGKTLGMVKDENRLWSGELDNLTISSAGVFSIENGIPNLETRDSFIAKFGTRISTENASRFSFAIQAYPKLLIDRSLQISDGVKNVHCARTSIGFSENANELFLVTINAKGESGGMTLYEYAHFVQSGQCGVAQKTVLNLDGGGSTSFAIPTQKIYEQVDRCRNLGNILTIQKR